MLTTRQRRMPGGVVIVELYGEVDLATEEVMRKALTDAVRTPGIRLLVCDMTYVSFFSCSGMTALMKIRAALHKRGARIRVVAQSPIVVLLFGVTGLTGVLGLCSSTQEAIQGPW
jgi:anti-sigma B factor antagonist